MGADAAFYINGEPVSEADIRGEVAALRKDLESRGAELGLEQRMQLREHAISRLVDRRLVFQESRRLGLTPTALRIEDAVKALAPAAIGADGVAGCRADVDMAEVSREAERRLTFERVIAHWSRNLRPPKSTEVRDYYRGHQAEFRHPEMVHASHLVRQTEEGNIDEKRAEIAAARERLLAGEDFAALAAICSDCPENGGDLGFFARGQMVEEFDAQVFSAPLHEVTPVFETRFGVHLAVVHERRPEGVWELDEVGGEIAEALFRQRQDQEAGRQLAALRKKAVLERAKS